MDQFEFALLIGALAVVTLCWNDRRAVAWVLIGAADFAVTTTYARHGGWVPYAFFTGIFDTAVGLLLLQFGRYRWEAWLLSLFQVMALMDWCQLAGLIPVRDVYVIGLELLNWAALFVIGGTHILERADVWMGRESVGAPSRSPLHRARVAAFSQRERRFLARRT